MIGSLTKSSIALAGMLCVAAPSVCAAHGYLVHSFPAAKTSLSRSPRHVRLVFSLKSDPRYSVVQIEDDAGNVLVAKAQEKPSREFSMKPPKLESGRYHVVYRMLAPDGDLMQGRIDFEVE